MFPDRSTSMAGWNWSMPSETSSSFTRTGLLHDPPPSAELVNKMSPKQYRACPPQNPNGSGFDRFRPSCQEMYTAPDLGPADRSTARPWRSGPVRKSPCNANPSPTGVTSVTIWEPPKLAPPSIDLAIRMVLVSTLVSKLNWKCSHAT